jgi:hypothetical protein
MNPFITSLLEQKSEESVSHHARMEAAMTEAFRHRQYDTIAQLAEEGVPFTKEMLDLAVQMKDPKLAQQCLQHGLVGMPENVQLKNIAGKRVRKK